ncbi:uncharacterized protein LOC133895083 [Phragmites australis]|uniref:uncharacterized protein LOC133895083 n=1 Tax=Phragmites australis TaxID=29695 RepID=UPI002D7992CC|nr:uncharacterized protein LOC133895083 [Phragmites australis]
MDWNSSPNIYYDLYDHYEYGGYEAMDIDPVASYSSRELTNLLLAMPSKVRTYWPLASIAWQDGLKVIKSVSSSKKTVKKHQCVAVHRINHLRRSFARHLLTPLVWPPSPDLPRYSLPSRRIRRLRCLSAEERQWETETEALIVLSLGFPIDELRPEERPLLPAPIADAPNDYIVVRNHILASWRADPSAPLPRVRVLETVAATYDHLVAAAHGLLVREGHINFGVSAAFPTAPPLDTPPQGAATAFVLVGGTGRAGIPAARQLLRFGLRVLVFEGRSHPGGRVYTSRLGEDKAVVELGDSVITGIHANPLGVLLCPWACLIMAIGLSALILGLWPMHLIWTYYCIIRTKLVGPVVKLLLLIVATAILILWLIVGIPGSVLSGLVYGFLAPIMATFSAIGESKEKLFVHCFVDRTWSTITGSCTVVTDVKDLLFHSYFSIMDDIRLQKPPDGKPYEIRIEL